MIGKGTIERALEIAASGECRTIDDVRRRHPHAEIAMLSAEQFTTQFLDALHGTGLPSFRRKFRGLHLLIIDDLQFLAGKRATLVELVHTFDAIQRDGRQIVFAADEGGEVVRQRLAGRRAENAG